MAAATDPATKLFGSLDVSIDGTAPLAAENIFTVLAAQLLAVYDRPANDPQLPAAFPAAYTVVKLDAQAGSTIRLSSDGQRLKFTYPGSFLKPDVTFSIK